MSFLLDTNVASEWTKPHPNPGVVEWLETVNEDDVFLSVVTFAELRHGLRFRSRCSGSNYGGENYEERRVDESVGISSKPR